MATAYVRVVLDERHFRWQQAAGRGDFGADGLADRCARDGPRVRRPSSRYPPRGRQNRLGARARRAGVRSPDSAITVYFEDERPIGWMLSETRLGMRWE